MLRSNLKSEPVLNQDRGRNLSVDVRKQGAKAVYFLIDFKKNSVKVEV